MSVSESSGSKLSSLLEFVLVSRPEVTRLGLSTSGRVTTKLLKLKPCGIGAPLNNRLRLRCKVLGSGFSMWLRFGLGVSSLREFWCILQAPGLLLSGSHTGDSLSLSLSASCSYAC